ncbi:MAG: flippase [Patescibacteria group bacterium]|nr:flippase [Patescibacteria group bacterium]
MHIKHFLFENVGIKQTLAKNSFWVFLSQIGGRFIRAGIVIYGARIIGAGEYGVFSYAISLAAILGIFSDLGIDTALFKQISATPEKIASYVANGIAMKAVLVTISIAAAFAFGAQISAVPGASHLLPLAMLMLVFDSLRESSIHILRARQKMEYEALLNLLTNFGILAFGLLSIAYAPTAFALIGGYMAGTAIGAIAAAYLLRPLFRDFFRNIRWATMREILHIGIPLALAGILGTLMLSTDTFILGLLRTPQEIGLYSAAQRPITLLYAFLGISPLVAFPIFARLVRENKEKLLRLCQAIQQFSLSLIFPAIAGGLIIAGPLMTILYGSSFVAGSLNFRILILTLSTNFFILLFTYLLLAHNDQKILGWYALAGFISNAIFDIALIPSFGGPGSAWATLINQVIVMGLILTRVKTHMNYPRPHIGKLIIATATMSLCTYASIGFLPVIANIILSIVVYLNMLYILKEPFAQEMLALFTSLREKNTKISTPTPENTI